MREIKFRAWSLATGMFYVAAEDLKSHEFEIFVENCMLMQSTGLKDKNSKEIYEGDIVWWKAGKTKYTPPGVVEYGTVPCDYEYENEGTGWVVNGCFLTKDCEIIGNVWEHPQLLAPATRSDGNEPTAGKSSDLERLEP